MVGCSAVNCSNRHSKGFRLFKFPADASRRQQWLLNCRRDLWQPTPGARICEIHFQENQWETKRADGWRKLKPNAIPTLFNVPNQKKIMEPSRKSKYKVPGTSENSSDRVEDQFLTYTFTNTEFNLNSNELEESESTSLVDQVKMLRNLLQTFREEICRVEEANTLLKSCLTKHIEILCKETEENNANIRNLKEQLQKNKICCEKF